MSSISEFKYREDCTDLLENVILRPRMYAQSLGELEFVLIGYSTAFCQLGIIERADSFDSKFCDWLNDKRNVPTPTGWVGAIESLASSEGKDPEKLFFELVREFLDQWGSDDK